MKVVAFDSGVGGLSAVAPLMKEATDIELFYLGDLANLPYGSKSREQVRSLVEKNFEWLFREGEIAMGRVDLALVACNTASALAMDLAEKVFSKQKVPVRGVLEAGCQHALRQVQDSGRIVVLATQATVRSEAYLKRLRELSQKNEILQQACPLFVPLVEDDLTSGPAVELIARRYLDSVLKAGDQVILGCTHYPFLRLTLEKLYPQCRWIDAGSALLKDDIVKSFLDKKSTEPPMKKLHIQFSDTSLSSNRLEKLLSLLGIAELL